MIVVVYLVFDFICIVVVVGGLDVVVVVVVVVVPGVDEFVPTMDRYAGLACRETSKSSGASLRLTGNVSSHVSSSAMPHSVTEARLARYLR